MADDVVLYGETSESHLLVSALARYPDRVAIHDGPVQVTYREVAQELSRYCQALRALGLGRGDRVGLLAGNRPEVLYASFALGLVGCVLVPLHPKGSLRDHRYMARDAGLTALIFAPSYSQRAAELVSSDLKMIALGSAPGFVDVIATARQFEPQPLAAPDFPADEVCRLSYSGGTTGEPKAIAATRRTLLTKTMIQLTEWEWPAEIRQLICAPLSHAGGAMSLPTWIRGGSIVILPGFDARVVLETIEAHRITCVLMVPTMIGALLDHPDRDKFDLRSLEVIYYGASAISPARLRQGIAALGPVFFQFYGQTEAPMTVTVLRRGEHDIHDDRRLASCGRPVPWVRVELLDDHDRPVPDGTPGEICVRGPLVMRGYWNKPKETEEALRGQWLHTGDMAVRDPDGFLRIVDRKKDMIISGGFNVFAREVESVLVEHPAVAECAVYGVPDPHWGEAVAAAIVVKSGATVTADQLIALVRDVKGPVQAPKHVEFVSELPLTSLGKPDKKALRKRHVTS